MINYNQIGAKNGVAAFAIIPLDFVNDSANITDDGLGGVSFTIAAGVGADETYTATWSIPLIDPVGPPPGKTIPVVISLFDLSDLTTPLVSSGTDAQNNPNYSRMITGSYTFTVAAGATMTLQLRNTSLTPINIPNFNGLLGVSGGATFTVARVTE